MAVSWNHMSWAMHKSSDIVLSWAVQLLDYRLASEERGSAEWREHIAKVAAQTGLSGKMVRNLCLQPCLVLHCATCFSPAVFITIADSVQQDGARPCLVFHAGDLVSSAAYTGVWYAAQTVTPAPGRPRSAATRPPMTSILHCSSLVDC